MDYSEAKRYVRELWPTIELRNELEFASFEEPPKIVLNAEEASYFHFEKNTIVLGLRSMLRYEPESREELSLILEYLRGHESQHRRSTAFTPYDWAVSRCYGVFVEAIAEMLEPGKHRRFKLDGDYDHYLTDTLPSFGITLSPSLLRTIARECCNILEDGRIENLRAEASPGFANLRRIFRWKTWNKEKEWNEEPDPCEYLWYSIGEIFSLSLTHLYSKGFVTAFFGTTLFEHVSSFIPFIRAAVTSTNTRYMAEEAVKLAELLAPDILEYGRWCKACGAGDPLLEKLKEEGNSEAGGAVFARDEKSEEAGNGLLSPVFSKSAFEERSFGLSGIEEEHGKAKKKTAKEKEEAGKEEESELEDEIRREYENASREELAKAAEVSSLVNEAAAHEAAAGSVVPDEDAPFELSGADREFLGNMDFKEFKRNFSLSQELPVVLLQRGKTMLRKNKRYFKSLFVPSEVTLDPARLSALACGDTDIFYKPNKIRPFDGCAYVLVDNSGSMRGAKRLEASKAAGLIEESIRGLNIPLKIVAFDEQRNIIIHRVIKGWNEQQKKNCCWNFAVSGDSGCGNEDNYDIRIATKELLGRPESKKLLLVLSDGTPCDIHATKEAIEDARKEGIIVKGIYFEEGVLPPTEPHFEYMYGRDSIICPLSELDLSIVSVFSKFFKR